MKRDVPRKNFHKNATEVGVIYPHDPRCLTAALRELKRKVARAGILDAVKEHRFARTPSQKLRRKRAEARRRRRRAEAWRERRQAPPFPL